MKKTPTILSVLAILLAVCALIVCISGGKCCQKAPAAEGEEASAVVSGGIVFVQIDSVLAKYDMLSDLRTEFESKAQAIETDLNKKGQKLESDGKAFENQINKGLLTRSAAEKQQAALLQRQQDLQNLAVQKQGELQEEQAVLMNKVTDAVKTYLEEYNKEKKYAAILSVSNATNILVTGTPAIDITSEIVEGLNAEYIKTRNAD